MTTDALIYKAPTPVEEVVPEMHATEYRAVKTYALVTSKSPTVEVIVQDSAGLMLAQLKLCPDCAMAMAHALIACAVKLKTSDVETVPKGAMH